MFAGTRLAQWLVVDTLLALMVDPSFSLPLLSAIAVGTGLLLLLATLPNMLERDPEPNQLTLYSPSSRHRAWASLTERLLSTMLPLEVDMQDTSSTPVHTPYYGKIAGFDVWNALPEAAPPIAASLSCDKV